MNWNIIALDPRIQPQQQVVEADIYFSVHQFDVTVSDQAASAAFRLVANDQYLTIEPLVVAVLVNQQPISSKTVLKIGDVIAYGNVEYMVEYYAQEAPKSQIARQMSEQGMLSLEERAKDVQVNREGMPKNIAIPKPAPIPQDINFSENEVGEAVETSSSSLENNRKNASWGAWSLVVLVAIVVAILWFFLSR